MKLRVVLVTASLGALVALAACDLNPQPLPPSDENDRGAGFSSSGGSSSGGFGGSVQDDGKETTDPNAAPNGPDGGTTNDGDASPDGGTDGGGDGGDGGASDASDSG